MQKIKLFLKRRSGEKMKKGRIKMYPKLQKNLDIQKRNKESIILILMIIGLEKVVKMDQKSIL